MLRDKNDIKQFIRAGRGIIPAHTVVQHGTLVNVNVWRNLQGGCGNL